MIRMPVRSRSQLILVALVAAISVLIYLAASMFLFRVGFPLDDAWIHQTYARNLVQHGEWAFQPGQPSAGSTALLWSLWLSLGHLINLGPYIWTFLSGWACLVTVAWQSQNIFRALLPERQSWAIWVALFMTMEYHLVWAAVSGMETLLFACFVLTVFLELFQPQPRWGWLGVIVGLSIWVRPDGITLMGPAIWVLIIKSSTWRNRWQSLSSLGISMGAFILIYGLINTYLSGNWLPNTFFAKQAEYAILRQAPLWKRCIDQTVLLMVGAGVLLLPGFVLLIRKIVSNDRWDVMAGILWSGGFLLLFAIRLPVVYQHGRYIIPVMPVYFLWSLIGMDDWIALKQPVLWKRVFQKAWLYALALVLIAFWGLGAQAYAQDVAIIESEMVTTARWIRDNTRPEALIAAHDIGALGYFSQREVLDLAGLISPGVIPFIRDEVMLEDFILKSQADYLVTFPGWYPNLIKAGVPVFTTGGIFSPAAGGENMVVYILNP